MNRATMRACTALFLTGFLACLILSTAAQAEDTSAYPPDMSPGDIAVWQKCGPLAPFKTAVPAYQPYPIISRAAQKAQKDGNATLRIQFNPEGRVFGMLVKETNIPAWTEALLLTVATYRLCPWDASASDAPKSMTAVQDFELKLNE
jgi:hypothetical protein